MKLFHDYWTGEPKVTTRVFYILPCSNTGTLKWSLDVCWSPFYYRVNLCTNSPTMNVTELLIYEINKDFSICSKKLCLNRMDIFLQYNDFNGMPYRISTIKHWNNCWGSVSATFDKSTAGQVAVAHAWTKFQIGLLHSAETAEFPRTHPRQKSRRLLSLLHPRRNLLRLSTPSIPPSAEAAEVTHSFNMQPNQN